MEVLDQTVWIHINYRTWQGKKTLTRQEISRYSDPDKTPPEDLITPGTKAITDPERLKKITSLGKKIHRECEKVCLKAFGAYGTSLEAGEALMTRLQAYKDEHNALLTEFLDNYEASNDAWAKEHPEWEGWLRTSMLSRAEIENRFKFEVQAYKISSGGEGALMNDGLEQEQHGLFGQLLLEVERMAKEAWEQSFENKDKTSQKAIRPIKTILNKLETLSYISGNIGVLTERVKTVLSALPKSGFIEGADLSSVCGLLNLLSSSRKMNEYIKQVSADRAQGTNQVVHAEPETVSEPEQPSLGDDLDNEAWEEPVTTQPVISEPASQPVVQSTSFAF